MARPHATSHRLESARPTVIAAVLAAMVGLAALVPPIPQDLSYHVMADRRTLLGVPHALNVLSNLPFAVVGVWGLAVVARNRRAFADAAGTRAPYALLFVATALTAVGSAYYHWSPDNARLVWDRLPMSVGFMGLLTAVVAERASRRAARLLFPWLVAVGAASVIYWSWTEGLGAGDLRPYALVQFGSLAVVVLLLVLYPAPYHDSRWLAAAIAVYGVAKGFELADAAIFSRGELVSGHTLKHLAAAGAVGIVVAMLRRRRPASSVRVPAARLS